MCFRFGVVYGLILWFTVGLNVRGVRYGFCFISPACKVFILLLMVFILVCGGTRFVYAMFWWALDELEFCAGFWGA